MKSFVLCLLSILAYVLLMGCGYFSDENDTNPQTKTCKYLKRQMVYNGRTNSADARFIAKSQLQDLEERYHEYGCDKI